MSRSRRSSAWCSACSSSWARCMRCCGSWWSTRCRSGCGSGPGRARARWSGGRRTSRACSTCCATRPMPGSTPTGAAAPTRPGGCPAVSTPAGCAQLDAGQWLVRIDGALPAYISVEQYERNQARLAANRARAESLGAPREGPALLGGLVVCGICGHRMQVSYETSGQGLTGRYCCQRRHHTYGEPRCQQMAARFLDEHVVAQAPVGAGPGRAGAVAHRRGAGRDPPGRGRPDLAAAAGTRRTSPATGRGASISWPSRRTAWWPASSSASGKPRWPSGRTWARSTSGTSGSARPGCRPPSWPRSAPWPATSRRCGPRRRPPSPTARGCCAPSSSPSRSPPTAPPSASRPP